MQEGGRTAILQSVPPDSRSSGRWALAASILGSGMAFLDGSVITVSLPVLQSQLGTSVATAQWIVEAYALFLSSLVLVGGSLADRFGAGRSSSSASSCSRAASLACGLAPGARTLIAARGLQGIGAALLVPSSLAMLGAAFSASERGKAVGTWSALTSLGSAIGPALGGWLVQAISWRAVFFINLPIAAVLLWITLRKVPETRNPARWPAGRGRSAAGDGRPWRARLRPHRSADPRMGRPAGLGHRRGGRGGTGGLRRGRRRSRHPMVPLSLFRNRTFTAANLLTLFLYAALAALFFFLPFVLIQARGYRRPRPERPFFR